MDGIDNLLAVQRGEPDVQDFPPPSAEGVTIVDVRRLRLRTMEDARDIVAQYIGLDIVKRPVESFTHHLVARKDSWFAEIGDVGLFYLTEVMPGGTASMDVLFWDKGFSSARRELVLSIVGGVFELFNLQKINAICPATNQPYAERLRKMGFMHEGTIRKGWDFETDALMFGILREELPCHVMTIPTSFLD